MIDSVMKQPVITNSALYYITLRSVGYYRQNVTLR